MLIERLKSFSRDGAIRGAASLMNLVEKSSDPVEFVFFSDFIVSNISAWDVLDNIIGSMTGVPRYFLNSELSLENLLASLPPILQLPTKIDATGH